MSLLNLKVLLDHSMFKMILLTYLLWKVTLLETERGSDVCITHHLNTELRYPIDTELLSQVFNLGGGQMDTAINRMGHQEVSFVSHKQAINSCYITINSTLIHFLTGQATSGKQGHTAYKDQCQTEDLNHKHNTHNTTGHPFQLAM